MEATDENQDGGGMRLDHRTRRFFVRACLLMAAGAAIAGMVMVQEVSAQGESTEFLGLSVPLEYHTNGNIRVNLMARVAKVDAVGDNIKAKNVRYEIFTLAGELDVLVAADAVNYSKKKGKADSESRVRVEKKGVVITGEGFTLDATNQVVSIKSNVVVVLDKGVDFKWTKP
jgi:hypothetical protein